MTGLVYEQVLELADRIEDYLGGWHPARGRRSSWWRPQILATDHLQAL